MTERNDGERRQQLLAGMIGGTLSKREEEELLAELSRDDEFAAEARELFRQGRLMETVFHIERDSAFVGKVLSCVRYSENKTAFVEKVSRKVERPAAWPVWAAVAACLTIIAGSVVYNVRKAGDLSGAIVARIRATSPGVEVKRNGTVVVAMPGIKLFAGDRIETRKSQDVSFEYEGEETRIDVLPETSLELGSAEKGKRLSVSIGKIEVRAAPQPEGRPMVVTTPHAEAEVMGTRFSLAVVAASTRLEVLEGTVKLTNMRDGSSVDVAANSYAVAREGITLAALPLFRLRIPGHDERNYIDGKIILEDGFENGLANWEIVVCGPRKEDRFAPAGPAEKACARTVQRRRDGEMTSCLTIDAPKGRNVRMGLQLKENVKADAYAIEWKALRMGNTVSSVVCPGANHYQQIYKAPRRSLDIRAGEWVRSRMECLPVDTIAGKRYCEIRTFMAGKLSSRHVTAFDHGGFILEVSQGQVIVDNFVIRELVPGKR